MKTRNCFLVGIGMLLLSGCQGDGQDGLKLTVRNDSNNTLRAIATVTTANTAVVSISYFDPSDIEATLHTIQDVTVTGEKQFDLIGMRAETDYIIEVDALTASSSLSKQRNFTTGSLPDGSPQTILSANSDTAQEGIVLIGISADSSTSEDTPVYFGIDEEGFIVWYLDSVTRDAESGATTPPSLIRLEQPGQLLVWTDSSVDIIDPVGNVITSYPIIADHASRILPNGNMLTFEAVQATVDGVLLDSQDIIEVDTSGNVVWTWSLIDNLDTSRFPGPLSEAVNSDGGLDWTHANSLYYIEDEDSIIMSSRSQSWVVKIDHDSGDLLWIMGDDNDVSEGFTANFFTLNSGTWMSNQHDASMARNGDIIMHDNRNENGGPVDHSRAVAYTIHEPTWTAEQVWSFTSPKYSPEFGSMQLLGNGNFFMCFCSNTSALDPSVTDSNSYLMEVAGDGSGEVVWELIIPDSAAYRAYKASWDEFLDFQ